MKIASRSTALLATVFLAILTWAILSATGQHMVINGVEIEGANGFVAVIAVCLAVVVGVIVAVSVTGIALLIAAIVLVVVLVAVLGSVFLAFLPVLIPVLAIYGLVVLCTRKKSNK